MCCRARAPPGGSGRERGALPEPSGPVSAGGGTPPRRAVWRQAANPAGRRLNADGCSHVPREEKSMMLSVCPPRQSMIM